MNKALSGYDKSYYDEHLGNNYHDEEKWLPLFERFADHIVTDFAPKRVLDIGCAFGYMVKYLRERGVEAWGIDTSSYAISQADEGVRPYLRVSSACDPLPEDIPQHYDLVLNIEVLEHLTMEDGEKAIARMCTYADTILFSSTGEDFDELTHINVQQPAYWATRFARYGFFKNLQYNMEYLSKFAFEFDKKSLNLEQVILSYEYMLSHQKKAYEKEQMTSGKLAQDIELVRKQMSDDDIYYKGEIERLTAEVKNHIQSVIDYSDELVNAQKQINEKETAITHIQEDLNEKNRIVQQMTSELTFNNDTIAKLENELAANNDTVTKLENELASSKQIIKDLDKAVEGGKQTINGLHADLDGLQATIQALNEQLLQKDRAMSELQRERMELLQFTAQLQNSIHEFTSSRGYKALCFYYRIRDRLLPKGSLRRKLIKKFSYLFIDKRSQPVASQADVALPSEGDSRSFYTSVELERQAWCRNHPLSTKVKFSIVVPVFRTPIPVLQDMIFSVKDQIYPNWELCILNASPEMEEIKFLIEQLAQDCDKILYRETAQNKGISGNTIDALAMATGDFIALLDHDDLIAPNALYEYALELEKDPEIEFFYSDKDMIDETGTQRMNPLFKPEYSPEIMYSANYFTHFCVIKRETLNRTDGFDPKADGAQDWDIFLKIMHETNHIKRVDQILYHWRILSTSVASGAAAKPYALDAQIYSIEQYIKRQGWKGTVAFQDKERSLIKVDWKFKEIPSVAIVSSAGANDTAAVLGSACSIISMDEPNWRERLDQCKADVLVFADPGCILEASRELLQELAAWAMHPEIAFVAPQLRTEQKIVSCGLVYEDGCVMDMFGGHPIGFYGQMGHSLWYRDFSAFRSTCVAIERKKFEKYFEIDQSLASFSLTHNCFTALSHGLRNVYDPFAWVRVDVGQLPEESVLSREFVAVCKKYPVPEVDPYFNHNCTIDVNRVRPIQAQQQPATEQTVLDKYASDALALASIFDFTQEDLEKNNQIVKTVYTGEVKRMVWFLQEFDYVFYAGLYTIFRTASYLQRKHGVEHTFVFIANTPANVMMERIEAGFPELRKCRAYSITSPNELSKIPAADVSICTLWTTAYYSLKFNKVKRKFYFIQDYEPLFYPAGSTFAQTEATYRFGFDGVANTEGLKEVYEHEYGGRAVSLDPSVDTNVFYPNVHRQYKKRQFTVFFYGRPGHPRNGFELGVEALKCLKRRMGNRVRIVTAGANYNTAMYGLDGVLENLGRLKIEETGDLYRSCDAGLVMMYTRHPSYLPYEMMACGCCVVSNYNAYTSWFLKDGQNAVVCEPSASSIAESIEHILLDEERRKEIGENGARQISENNPSWDDSLEKVARFILFNE